VGAHGGARLDTDSLILSTLGRFALRGSRAVEGTPTTVTIARAADGWYVACSGAEVPTAPLPRTGKATDIDLGLQVFLATAEGEAVAPPRHDRLAERQLMQTQRR
jgi:putative transposase